MTKDQIRIHLLNKGIKSFYAGNTKSHIKGTKDIVRRNKTFYISSSISQDDIDMINKAGFKIAGY